MVRLSLLYALLDCSSEIEVEHLRAALALWEYARHSAELIFGQRETWSPLESKILQLLQESQTGYTRSELHKLLGGRCKAEELLAALAKLKEQRAAHCEKIAHPGSGRPAERWLLLRKKELITPESSENESCLQEGNISFFRKLTTQSEDGIKINDDPQTDRREVIL
jgi:hypothetical protein